MARPVLVLRDNTERIEGIFAGAARLVGSDRESIVSQGSLLVQNVTFRKYMSSKGEGLYGSGKAALIIINVIRMKSAWSS